MRFSLLKFESNSHTTSSQPSITLSMRKCRTSHDAYQMSLLSIKCWLCLGPCTNLVVGPSTYLFEIKNIRVFAVWSFWRVVCVYWHVLKWERSRTEGSQISFRGWRCTTLHFSSCRTLNVDDLRSNLRDWQGLLRYVQCLSLRRVSPQLPVLPTPKRQTANSKARKRHVYTTPQSREKEKDSAKSEWCLVNVTQWTLRQHYHPLVHPPNASWRKRHKTRVLHHVFRSIAGEICE